MYIYMCVHPCMQELQGTPTGSADLAELDHQAGLDSFLRSIGYDGRYSPGYPI